MMNHVPSKKKLNIKDFWKDVESVKFRIDFKTEEFILDYYMN